MERGRPLIILSVSPPVYLFRAAAWKGDILI
eukprot:COSAG05_NODE_214_length_13907_cov_28.992178_13_plen_31_part_00